MRHLVTLSIIAFMVSMNAYATFSINLKIWLQGAYDPNTNLMRDDLRVAGLIPMTEPFTDLGFTHYGEGGGETIGTNVITFSGPNAIVDWVLIALRDINTHSIVATKSALINRSGYVRKAHDGSVGVRFDSLPNSGSYLVSVFHRNHFSVTTASQVSEGTSFDFTVTTSQIWGATGGGQPEVGVDTLRLGMWAGDVNHDGILKYTGANNDREPILLAIGGIVPTNTVPGYMSEDVNMDGMAKYTNVGNDRDIILSNLPMPSVPTSTRTNLSP